MLEWWLSLTEDDNLTAYEMMAQAYYQLERYRDALTPARKVIELTKAEGKPVKEHSLLLMRVLYYELGEYDEVAFVLKDLIARYPKKQYWIQLASLYGQMEDQNKQLVVLELAYLQGYLQQESEVLTYASLLLNNELPLRAAHVLENGLADDIISSTLEHWRLLAQAWTLAQEYEKAIPALTRAAELSSDGKMDLILAQSFMNLDRWEECVAAARNGVRKGGLDRVDQAHVLIGQALFELDRFDEARQAFIAAQADRRSRQLAAQWLSYIDSEEERQAKLREALE
jgi:tetratricopeptide (TPR) repeat protein